MTGGSAGNLSPRAQSLLRLLPASRSLRRPGHLYNCLLYSRCGPSASSLGMYRLTFPAGIFREGLCLTGSSSAESTAKPQCFPTFVRPINPVSATLSRPQWSPRVVHRTQTRRQSTQGSFCSSSRVWSICSTIQHQPPAGPKHSPHCRQCRGSSQASTSSSDLYRMSQGCKALLISTMIPPGQTVSLLHQKAFIASHDVKSVETHAAVVQCE